ncbi:MAG: divergent polysaccharide deacetylase family protein [Deltaproteobacteria bacterium]|nr:divergent polysaccharide deacetylase family protein [Deltaproteobacteria bacterium]
MKKSRKSRKKKGNDNIKLLYFFLGVALLLGATLYFLGKEKLTSPYPPQQTAEIENNTVSAPPIQAEERTEGPPTPEVKGVTLPKLAIIIDDIGFTKRYTDLIAIKLPITYAIIPYTIHSVEAAADATRSGMEVILHLPMEPRDYPEKDPGRGGLLISMDESSIIKELTNNLDMVPHIKGVNNHMGSRFTEYARGMELVLGEIKKRGLFFIDSKTSYKSRAYSLAKKMNIKSAERNVFLDNVQTEDAIEKQLEKAVAIAREKGEAIAIGHPYPATISTLAKVAPGLKERGVELVFASSLAK